MSDNTNHDLKDDLKDDSYAEKNLLESSYSKEKVYGLSLQQAYAKIGGFSTFQYLSSFLLIWGFSCGAFLFFGLSALEKQPRYLCYNQDGTTYECKADETFCKDPSIKYYIDWDYDSSLHNWVEDLNLTCVSSGKIGLIGSIYFVGWCLAALILPRLSDIFGRKIIYLISMIAHLICYIGLILSRNLDLTIAIMFFFGFFSLGRASVGYLYMQELLPQKQQALVGSILQILNGLVTVFVCLYFLYISKYWIPFQIFGAALNAACVLGILFLPESPKFLISKKRYDEARIALKTIARANKYQGSVNFKFDREVIDENRNKVNASLALPTQSDNYMESPIQGRTELDLLKSPIQQVQEEQQLNGTLKDLVKIRKHLINLLILITIWIGSSFNYYLINFQLKYIKGDFFVNTIVASLTEVPAYILGGIAYQKVGIKITLITCFSISIVGAICLIIFQDNVDVIPVFILAARFGVSATFNICYLANAQIFPTIFAGTAFGVCNFFAKLATIISPLLAEVDPPVPMIVFVIVAGIACVLSFFIIQDTSKNKVMRKK